MPLFVLKSIRYWRLRKIKNFEAVYGELPKSGYPICIGNFLVFYPAVVQALGIKFPGSLQGCPASTNAPTHFESVLRFGDGTVCPWLGSLYHFSPWAPLEAHQWYEIIHRRMPNLSGAWFFYTPGSGERPDPCWNSLSAHPLIQPLISRLASFRPSFPGSACPSSSPSWGR